MYEYIEKWLAVDLRNRRVKIYDNGDWIIANVKDDTLGRIECQVVEKSIEVALDRLDDALAQPVYWRNE